MFNEFENSYNQVMHDTKFKIPFADIPPTKKQKKHEDLTISQFMDSDVSKKHSQSFGNFGSYSGNSRYFNQKVVEQIKDNKCLLLAEWARYIENNAKKAGFSYKEYTTYGDYNIDHSDPESDSKQFRALFEEFLKQKNIKLVTDEKSLNETHFF